MESLPKFNLGAKMPPFVKLYVRLTNHMLYMTRVAKCNNLHAVTLLHSGIKDSIGKTHKRKMLLDTYKQEQTRVMLPDI